MVSKDVQINFRTGSDARPIALIVQEASKYDSKIYLETDNKRVNVKSIMGMMSLVLKNGNKVSISADGPDEETAIENIAKKMSR
ncbi:MAG: HPr family phosphocarrier protein [Lachnospiraceae bacterium]|nr:HPr family phosphocarrier protein [Lachnospiraceae bacterium]MBR6274660.1 HPr family phosphocarrier protein [Lachnospiraceae bacterium]